jgi:hypothetical protein
MFQNSQFAKINMIVFYANNSGSTFVLDSSSSFHCVTALKSIKSIHVIILKLFFLRIKKKRSLVVHDTLPDFHT